MNRSAQFISGTGGIGLRVTVAATAIATLLIIAAAPAYAQTFSVLHSFNGPDGGDPESGLTIDPAGNLYGVTWYGGSNNCGGGGCGTVFKLSHAHSSWVLSTLYAFLGDTDGASPDGGVVFGPQSKLYGVTASGGANGPYGTVFSLRPGANFCQTFTCPWTETTLFSFDGTNGSEPSGDLIFDTVGNIYGTTQFGGESIGCAGRGCGVVYQLAASGGGWTQNVLYEFQGIDDGGLPVSGVILDAAGNLDGAAPEGRDSAANGVIFQVSPSGSSWTETVLYAFQNQADGNSPTGGLILDTKGNLYGTASAGGSQNGGTVFELSPLNNVWNFILIYGFSLHGMGEGTEGPTAQLLMDTGGNLYGSTLQGGAYGYGSVFKLSPTAGGYVYTSLHDFTGGDDGRLPTGRLVMDSSGDLYGTAEAGGHVGGEQCGYSTCGVVFEIVP